MKAEMCSSFMFLVINYILSNEFALYCKFIYFIYWWNDNDRGKTEELGEKPAKFLFVHYKSHMNWRGIEPAPTQGETDD